MRRNNEERLLQGHKPATPEDPPQLGNPMDFVTPTQFVELPSKGRYPNGHPMHGKDSIEIKYMTAKDEDILTNRSLLKKGLAFDRLIQNLIKEPGIDAKSLYVGDRNAIIIYARASAYGEDYITKMQCPACGEVNKINFDLSNHENYCGDEFDHDLITENDDCTFTVTLPVTKMKVILKPMTGLEESKMIRAEKAKDMSKNLMTKQLKHCIVDVNGYSDEKTINWVAQNLVAKESRFLRKCINLITPDVKMEHDFVCKNCDHEGVVTVPFGTDFFWPE